VKLPCETCKFKKIRHEGHRIFIGCSDPEKKKNNFQEDTWAYQHSCTAYEQEELAETLVEAKLKEQE